MADPFDGPEIATLAVGVLSLVGVLISVLYGRRASSNARQAKEQVQNDHEVNLRDDIDGIKRLIGSMSNTVTALDRGQLRLLSEVGLLRAGWQTNRNDIDDLMDTAQQRRKRDEWEPPPPQSRRARRWNDAE